MTQRRRYTKTEKAAAVATALNSSTKAAAETLGIPRTTLGQWLDQPEYVALRHETRDAVADKFWSVIQVGLEEVAKGLRDPDAALRDKSVALGVLYDKHALLTGGATNRSESRDITGTLSDAELVDTIRVIDGGRSGASEPSSGEAAG